MQSSSTITDVEVHTSILEPVRGEIKWKLLADSGGGIIYFNGEPATITSIWIVQHGVYTLQEIIDVYGSPSHIVASASPCIDTDCIVHRLDILFIPQGFALSWAESVHVRPEFGPETKKFFIEFFEPTVEGYLVATGNPNRAEIIRPWRGILGFDAYCLGPACEDEP
jgi:hypothetical protein